MEFTVEELRDIYWSLLDSNDVDLLRKIEFVYQFCSGCNQLIKHEDYQRHFDECPMLNAE